MKIPLLRTELPHADENTDRNDETNSPFFAIFGKRIKINRIFGWKDNINGQPENAVTHRIFPQKIPNKFQVTSYH
jgi:hypothetical protein